MSAATDNRGKRVPRRQQSSRAGRFAWLALGVACAALAGLAWESRSEEPGVPNRSPNIVLLPGPGARRTLRHPRRRLLVLPGWQVPRLGGRPHHRVAGLCPGRIRRPCPHGPRPDIASASTISLEMLYRLTREETATPYRLNVGDEVRVESFTDAEIKPLVADPARRHDHAPAVGPGPRHGPNGRAASRHARRGL